MEQSTWNQKVLGTSPWKLLWLKIMNQPHIYDKNIKIKFVRFFCEIEIERQNMVKRLGRGKYTMSALHFSTWGRRDCWKRKSFKVIYYMPTTCTAARYDDLTGRSLIHALGDRAPRLYTRSTLALDSKVAEIERQSSPDESSAERGIVGMERERERRGRKWKGGTCATAARASL